MKNPLDQIIFISLPESLFEGQEDLPLDPSILLPVDIGPTPPSEWDIGNISWEAMEAGLIKVLAWDSQREECPYYKEVLLSIRPQIRKELLNMAIAKSRQGEYDLAREIFLALKTIDPDSSMASLNLAVHYESYARRCEELSRFEDHQYNLLKAKEEFQEALSKNPIPPEAYYMASLFYYSQGDYAQAHSLMQSFLVFSSKDDKRRERAQEITKKLIQLEKEQELYRNAFQKIEEDKNQEGCQMIETFLESSPDSWNGWFLLGWGQRKQQHWNKALEAFMKAASLQDPTADLLNEMAICHLELEEYKQTRKLLEQARKLSPSDIRILSNLAILEWKEGKKEDAKKWFLKVLDIDPSDLIALEYIEILNQSS